MCKIFYQKHKECLQKEFTADLFLRCTTYIGLNLHLLVSLAHWGKYCLHILKHWYYFTLMYDFSRNIAGHYINSKIHHMKNAADINVLFLLWFHIFPACAKLYS